MIRLFLAIGIIASLAVGLTAGCGGDSTDEETAALTPTSASDSNTEIPGGPLDPSAVETGLSVDGSDVAALAVGQAGDTEAPSLTAPVNIKCPPQPGGINLGTPDVSDNSDPNPTVTNDAPANFPAGVTTVTWTATDASGNTSTAVQMVDIDVRVPPAGGQPH